MSYESKVAVSPTVIHSGRIKRDMEELTSSIEFLKEQVSTLKDNLSPVLAEKVDDQSLVGEVPQERSQLSHEINNCRRDIVDIQNTLMDVIERLEL